MADAPSKKLASILGSLDSTAQSQVLGKYVLPLLDKLQLNPETRQQLLDNIQLTKLRWRGLPRLDFTAKKEEMAEIIIRLKQNTKTSLMSDGMDEQNFLMEELLFSVLDWLKQLWILGVEFGQEQEAVHDSLTFVSNLAPQMSYPTISECTCILSALKARWELRRSDGEIMETFSGSVDKVLRKAIITVWRDLLLAMLVKPENQSDTCWFVTQRLPSMFTDAMDANGLHLRNLYTLLDPADEPGAGGDAEDTDSEYLDPEDADDSEWTDDEDDDESDEEMPPLIDINGGIVKPPPKPAAATRDADSDEDSDDSMPPLVDNQGNFVTEMATSSSKPQTEPPASNKPPEPANNGYLFDEDSDDTDEPAPFFDELEDEDSRRLDEIPRLTKYITAHVMDMFKKNPTATSFKILLEHVHTPELEKDLLEHITTMPHSTATLEQSVPILLSKKATSHILKIINLNQHLTPRIPHTMVDIAEYLNKTPSTRKHVAPLLQKQMKVLMADMVVEIEYAFRGLVNVHKKTEVAEIMKIAAADRPPVIKRWVEEIVTPKPEALSEEAQVNTSAPAMENPFNFLAAFGLDVPGGMGGADQSNKLYIDPIEELAPVAHDHDFDPLFQLYRPPHGVHFADFLGVATFAVREGDKATALMKNKLNMELLTLAPYIRYKAFVEAMKSKIPEERWNYLRRILTELHVFSAAQSKTDANVRKKMKAKAEGNAASSTSSQPSTSNTNTNANVPLANISPFMLSLLGMSLPGALFGLTGGAPPNTDDGPPPTWDSVD